MRKKHHLFLSIIGGWMLFMLCSNKARGQVPFEVKGKLCIPDQECKSDSVSFADTLKTSTAWRWDFGDLGAGASNFSTKKNPKHVYQSPGIKLVTLVRTVNGVQETVTKTITIGVPPPQFQNWRRDTMICKEDLGKLVLNPYPTNAPNGAKYMWFPKGDTTQTLRVDSSGCYSVEVTNIEGCTYEDRINVKVCLEPLAQEGAKWFFGNNAGLDFAGGGAPQPILNGQIKTPEGTSSISNTKGQLLFYTDGVKIYNKDGAVMASKDGDTTALGGSPNSTQSALIVPQPTCRGCEYLYYVFTTSEINGKKQFSYSVVDMRRNGGKGEIVEKNHVLNDNTTERIASVRNDRDSTYWIVTHDYKSNAFRVYHATKAGISTPKLYPLGAVQDTTNKAEGYMKFSTPDSTGMRRLAVVVPGPPRNLVQIYNFNDSSGRLSGPITVDLGPAPPKAYGVEFSPDGTKMYVSLQKGATDTTYSKLWQFDITGDSARIADSKILIDSSATKIYGALQIGSDSRIYMAIKDSQYLGVINAPDEDSQDEVRFVLNGIFLGGKISQLGLPNFVQNFTEPSTGPGFTYADTCSNQPTNFQASPLCDPIKDTYTWNFGDGSAPMSGQNQQVQHTYKSAGTYTVSLNLKNKCKDTTITQRITIIATPDPIKLKSPIDTCVNRLVLDAGVQAEQYLWLRNGVPISRQKTISLRPNGGSGSYRVFAANGVDGQCRSVGNTQITLRQPPAYSLGPDTSLCVGGGTVVLNAKPTPTNWNKFLWNTGETTQLITVKTPGSYSVQVTINAGTPQACVNEDTIGVRPLPKARMQATLVPPTGCTTRDGRIVIGAITPNGNYSYSWFGANDTPLTGTGNTLANLAEGTYKVRLTGNSAVCATDSSFSLKVVKTLRLQPTIVNARCTLPSSGAINLNTLAGTPTRYVWTTAQGAGIGTSAPLLSNLTPGKYNVKVTDAGGCDTTLNDITVGIIPEKFLSLGPDRQKCIGDTALLIPVLPALAGNQYKWSTGETTNRITVSRAGTYTLTVTNSVTGCTDTDDFGYSLAPRPVYDLTKDVGICDLDIGATATLIIRPTTPNLTYFWLSPLEARTSRVTVDKAGTYLVRISNPASCEVIDTARVVVRCEPRIYIPDVFTPNGDGNNDVLKVYGDHLTDFELKIFNRWGEVIFYTNDITKQWDGKYRDELYPPMVYPYVVSFKSKFFPERPRSSQRGAVMLLR